MAEHFNSQNFEEKVLKSQGLTLVDFFATWCGPCQALAPIIDKISADPSLTSKISIGKLDVDESQDIAAKYGVMSIPTLIFFNNGKEINRIMGSTQEAKLRAEIEAMIKQVSQEA